MSPLWLHLRARHLTGVTLALPLVVVLTQEVAQRLVVEPGGAAARLPVTAVAPLVVTVLLSLTLAGADVELDRSQPRLTWRLRAGHTLAALAVAGSALAVTTLEEPQVYGAGAMVRNAVGLFGLILLSTGLWSPRANWVPAFAYTVAVSAVAPDPSSGAAWWAWLIQPGRLDPSWIAAVALLTAGLIVYVRRGPSRNG